VAFAWTQTAEEGQSDYVTRTVANVVNNPDVLAALHRRAERRKAQERRAGWTP